jgi:hypothetical protein
VTKVRNRTLVLAAIAFLVVWYFTGGREEFAYRESVRQAKALGTFTPMMLEHWGNHGILYFASVLGIYVVVVIFAVRIISVLVKTFTRAKG